MNPKDARSASNKDWFYFLTLFDLILVLKTKHPVRWNKSKKQGHHFCVGGQSIFFFLILTILGPFHLSCEPLEGSWPPGWEPLFWPHIPHVFYTQTRLTFYFHTTMAASLSGPTLYVFLNCTDSISVSEAADSELLCDHTLHHRWPEATYQSAGFPHAYVLLCMSCLLRHPPYIKDTCHNLQ